MNPDTSMPGHEVSGCAEAQSAPAARVRDVLRAVAGHYQDALRASPKAVSYLRRRGVGGAAAARFGLGFAPAEWHGLEPVLTKFDESAVLASGLQVIKDDDSRRFDRFRGRLMFPIRDRSGEIAGFGGRVLDGTQPKYMNSPESAAFRKRELLYGLFEAQGAIAQEQLALIVEGYLDVLTLSQAGFLPVVGTLGTSCTPAHVKELLSITPRLVFCFDGDAAGLRAAAHAIENILPLADDAHAFSFLFLPSGEDPDSYVRAHGVCAFRDLLGRAVPLVQVLESELIAGCDLTQPEGRALCCARAKPFWLALPAGLVRDELLEFCSQATRFSTEDLLFLWTGQR